MAPDIDQLQRENRIYDVGADIVANFQFWSEVQPEFAGTVSHFERFPSIPHPDTGNLLSPDFTILFKDGTALVGEVARQALHANSFESLWKQADPYCRFGTVPDSSGNLVDVTALDLVIATAHNASNTLCQNLSDRQAEEKTSYSISVMEYSLDPADAAYTFKCPSTAGNGPPPGHGRDPSFESWLADAQDGLRGLSKNYTIIKAVNRFTNDPIPPLYLAIVLWSEVFAALSCGESRDLTIVPSVLAEEMRETHGSVRAADVKKALELLQAARLATKQGGKFLVAYRELGDKQRDLEDEIVKRLESPPTGPVSIAERQRRAANVRQRAENKARQTSMDVD